MIYGIQIAVCVRVCACACVCMCVCVFYFAPSCFLHIVCECVIYEQDLHSSVCTFVHVNPYLSLCALKCVCLCVNHCSTEKLMFNSLCHKSVMQETILNFIGISLAHLTQTGSHLSLSTQTQTQTDTYIPTLHCTNT